MANDAGSTSCEIRLQSSKKKHQEYMDQQHLIGVAERRFASVWATSGLSVGPKGFWLGWGVVLVDEGRKGLNLTNQASITCYLDLWLGSPITDP